MPTRLPPLNSLRAFEAAARYLSFAAAARDLHVTTAAISHQVKLLEASLDLQLFVRRNNQLLLTVAGETYLPKVREAFRSLREGTEHLIGFSSVNVRLSVRPGLCHYWLLPRLASFFHAHPGVHVSFDTEVDRDYLQHDITIDYRPATAPNYLVQQLFATPIYPVCAPSYAPLLKEGADLEQAALLHDRPLQGMPEYPDWQSWLSAAGLPSLTNSRGATFATSQLSLQAAEQGLGVALGQHALVSRALAAGRLVTPLPLVAPLRMPYYMIHSVSAAENPGVQTLANWLLTEASHETQ